MLDGTVVAGEHRMPPPLADRFAFERQFHKAYDSIASHFIPLTDDKGDVVLGPDGRPRIVMDPNNPVPSLEDAFFFYASLRRQGKVQAKYELWSEQLDSIEVTVVGVDDEEGAAGEEPAGAEVDVPRPPSDLVSPLRG